MNLILFCVFLTFSVGLFLLLAGLLRLPTLKTSRVMMDTGKEGKQLSKTLDAFYMDGAVKIAKYIRMNDYKKNRMANVLRASGLGMTPEVYTAYAYLKAGSVFLLIIPALHVFPLAALFVILLGIMIYYKEIQKADEMLKEKREQIEEELYRFVSTITQELKNSRDVLSMLEHYKENAGAAFRKELDIVCADMRSSSYEAALTRFEARLNSPQLSDVVRGLIGVLRGDDGAVYFQMLTHDFKQTELQRLKAKAAKIPPKIRKILRDKRGEGYIDVAVMVLCVMLVIALGVRLFPIFITKMQVDNFADELAREAEISGRVGSETSNRQRVLEERTGIHPTVQWSRTGNLQLNEEVTVTVTIQKDLGLFGNFGSFPITIRARASGKSEVYWK